MNKLLLIPLALLFLGCDIIDKPSYQFNQEQSKALSMFFSQDQIKAIAKIITVDKSITDNGRYLTNRNIIKLNSEDSVTVLHEAVHWYQFKVIASRVPGNVYDFDYDMLDKRLNVEQEATLVSAYYESLSNQVFMHWAIRKHGEWVDISANRKQLVDYMAKFIGFAGLTI